MLKVLSVCQKVKSALFAYKSLAEFRHPQMTEYSEITFFPGACTSEKTLLSPASVRIGR